jgi:HNH endonuclease
MPKTCVYCGQIKPDEDFTLEHIWPDALGGAFLPALFRTTDVCQRCNNVAGLFVDGAFLKSWPGQAERFTGAYDFVDLDVNSNSVVPLAYMGPISDAPKVNDDIYEMWLGPCGSHVVHARTKSDDEDKWATYAGGDAIASKKKPGRVYISLTTEHPGWIALALRSVKAHFSKESRYIVNAELPPEWKNLASAIEQDDAQQANDLNVVQFVQNASSDEKHVRHGLKLSVDPDHRLLAKLALGIGYTLFGQKFLHTAYAGYLRQGMREKDRVKRAQLPIRGVGFLNSVSSNALRVLAFPGAWVIQLKIVETFFMLSIVTPLGNSMIIVISDSQELWNETIFEPYQEGVFYVVVPAAATAVGPISTSDYLSHISKQRPFPSLAQIEAKKINPASLPPCR